MVADQFEVLSQKARQALAEGNPEPARMLYQQALAERADSPDAHFGMATASFLLNDLLSAAHHFKEVTQLDPRRAGAFINLGAIYNRMNRLDDAVTALRRGIQLNSKRAEAYFNLGIVYRRKGQMELAVDAYKEATRLNPRMAEAHYNLGNLLLELGRHSQAISHYKKALEINPQFEGALAGLRDADAAQTPQAAAVTESKSDSSRVPAPKPAAGKPSTVDMNRPIDPLHDGPVLAAIHQATIASENLQHDFLRLLEHEVEPAIKDLAATLLHPEKAAELSGRLHKFEVAMQDLLNMQRNMQQSMKTLRSETDQLFMGHKHA